MARRSADPLTHVISFRVNEDEKTALDDLADELGIKVSTLLRGLISLMEDGSTAKSLSFIREQGFNF